jgi:hypothetical protein
MAAGGIIRGAQWLAIRLRRTRLIKVLVWRKRAAARECDRAGQGSLRPPLPDEALDAFSFRKVLHYSAQEDRGRGALNDALADAVRWLRRQQGGADRIGTGRAAVKTRLRRPALYLAGGVSRPVRGGWPCQFAAAPA